MKFTTSNEWLSLTDQHVALIRSHQQKFPIAVGAIAKDFGINVKVSTLPAGISGEIKDENGVIVIRVNRHD
ncbi:TPA: hypothetical protein N3F14_005510, partial [Klebsiella pneumoniae]|nr:hypothetical protein [Klebsiella pneumoniae]